MSVCNNQGAQSPVHVEQITKKHQLSQHNGLKRQWGAAMECSQVCVDVEQQ
jgi:hypothetical protein